MTFQGNFKYHPLMGGSPGKPDSASPFSSHQDGVVTIELPGDYGYYCTLHDSMKGAIFVE